jgi:NACHT domain
VQARSYGARRQLIEAPLRELDLDITPRLGWVRDPRLVEPELTSEKKVADDIIAAFESSKRRLLIVGEPGSGKTMAAYSLIEYLDEAEGAEGRIPLLINLSAWEAQDDFGSFLVDYLCSSVGYQVRERALARVFIGSDRYALILDGLDEIPVRLRAHFSERLDEFVRGQPSEVGVVVTCRTQEYAELLGNLAVMCGMHSGTQAGREVQGTAAGPSAARRVDWARGKAGTTGRGGAPARLARDPRRGAGPANGQGCWP